MHFGLFTNKKPRRSKELIGSPFVTVNNVQSFGLEVILSQNDINMLMMLMILTVEQHEMVPFNDRLVSSQFKGEINVNGMQTRLHTRVNNLNHWLNELVNDMLDILPTPELNYESASGALNELDILVFIQ